MSVTDLNNAVVDKMQNAREDLVRAKELQGTLDKMQAGSAKNVEKFTGEKVTNIIGELMQIRDKIARDRGTKDTQDVSRAKELMAQLREIKKRENYLTDKANAMSKEVMKIKDEVTRTVGMKKDLDAIKVSMDEKKKMQEEAEKMVEPPSEENKKYLKQLQQEKDNIKKRERLAELTKQKQEMERRENNLKYLQQLRQRKEDMKKEAVLSDLVLRKNQAQRTKELAELKNQNKM